MAQTQLVQQPPLESQDQQQQQQQQQQEQQQGRQVGPTDYAQDVLPCTQRVGTSSQAEEGGHPLNDTVLAGGGYSGEQDATLLLQQEQHQKHQQHQQHQQYGIQSPPHSWQHAQHAQQHAQQQQQPPLPAGSSPMSSRGTGKQQQRRLQLRCGGLRMSPTLRLGNVVEPGAVFAATEAGGAGEADAGTGEGGRGYRESGEGVGEGVGSGGGGSGGGEGVGGSGGGEGGDGGGFVDGAEFEDGDGGMDIDFRGDKKEERRSGVGVGEGAGIGGGGGGGGYGVGGAPGGGREAVRGVSGAAGVRLRHGVAPHASQSGGTAAAAAATADDDPAVAAAAPHARCTLAAGGTAEMHGLGYAVSLWLMGAFTLQVRCVCEWVGV